MPPRAAACCTPASLRILHIAEAVLAELDRMHGGFAKVLLDHDEVAAIAHIINASRIEPRPQQPRCGEHSEATADKNES